MNLHLCYLNPMTQGFPQKKKPEKAQLGTLENMYVRDDCHRPSTFRDLLRKRSARQNV